MLTQNWPSIVAASVVPVVIISACGLLCLALYNRLSMLVNRLRTFDRERRQEQERLSAETEASAQEQEREYLSMLEVQTERLIRRARLIRAALMCLLSGIATLLFCSLLLGLSVAIPVMTAAAGVLFLAGLGLAISGVLVAINELRAALEPIELESRFIAKLNRVVR